MPFGPAYDRLLKKDESLTRLEVFEVAHYQQLWPSFFLYKERKPRWVPISGLDLEHPCVRYAIFLETYEDYLSLKILIKEFPKNNIREFLISGTHEPWRGSDSDFNESELLAFREICVVDIISQLYSLRTIIIHSHPCFDYRYKILQTALTEHKNTLTTFSMIEYPTEEKYQLPEFDEVESSIIMGKFAKLFAGGWGVQHLTLGLDCEPQLFYRILDIVADNRKIKTLCLSGYSHSYFKNFTKDESLHYIDKVVKGIKRIFENNYFLLSSEFTFSTLLADREEVKDADFWQEIGRRNTAALTRNRLIFIRDRERGMPLDVYNQCRRHRLFKQSAETTDNKDKPNNTKQDISLGDNLLDNLPSKTDAFTSFGKSR